MTDTSSVSTHVAHNFILNSHFLASAAFCVSWQFLANRHSDGATGLDFRQGQELFLFPKVPKVDLRFIQHPIIYVQGALPPRVEPPDIYLQFLSLSPITFVAETRNVTFTAVYR